MYQPFSINTFVNIFAVIFVLWTLPWKLYAVWLAAKHDHKRWFAVLVLFNTFAILELIYVFKVAKKSWPEVKSDFHKAWQSLVGSK